MSFFLFYLDDVVIVVNEEGKIIGLPFNRALRDEKSKILDLLFGTFFICGLGEENVTDIPKQAIPFFLNLTNHGWFDNPPV